jgi:hypothetical protein
VDQRSNPPCSSPQNAVGVKIAATETTANTISARIVFDIGAPGVVSKNTEIGPLAGSCMRTRRSRRVSTRLSHAKREKRASTHDIWSLPAFPERLEAFMLRQLVPRPGAPMATEASKRRDAVSWACPPFLPRTWSEYVGRVHPTLPVIDGESVSKGWERLLSRRTESWHRTRRLPL